ncbi:MAG: polysaccharide biosynthesis/export family protein [Thiolinea sp.]
MRAQGLTTAQLEQEIARRLGESYMNNPQVSVLLKESVQNRVTVEVPCVNPVCFR